MPGTGVCPAETVYWLTICQAYKDQMQQVKGHCKCQGREYYLVLGGQTRLLSENYIWTKISDKKGSEPSDTWRRALQEEEITGQGQKGGPHSCREVKRVGWRVLNETDNVRPSRSLTGILACIFNKIGKPQEGCEWSNIWLLFWKNLNDGLRKECKGTSAEAGKPVRKLLIQCKWQMTMIYIR